MGKLRSVLHIPPGTGFHRHRLSLSPKEMLLSPSLPVRAGNHRLTHFALIIAYQPSDDNILGMRPLQSEGFFELPQSSFHHLPFHHLPLDVPLLHLSPGPALIHGASLHRRAVSGIRIIHGTWRRWSRLKQIFPAPQQPFDLHQAPTVNYHRVLSHPTRSARHFQAIHLPGPGSEEFPQVIEGS